jgi:isopenicillin N synthase-like dioxygenase
MTVEHKATSGLKVPSIDVSPYLADPTSVEALKVVAAVRSACSTIGFFELTGHGVPKSLQKQVFSGAQKLFALPLEEKLKVSRQLQAPLGNRGYEAMGTQVLQ